MKNLIPFFVHDRHRIVGDANKALAEAPENP